MEMEWNVYELELATKTYYKSPNNLKQFQQWASDHPASIS